MLQAEVIGNLGSNAEIKELNGKKYVAFSVAHSERRRSAMGTTESTMWISVLWYGDGGALTQYLATGAKVFVRGRLVPKIFTDKNNQSQCALNVYASEVILCGAKNDAVHQSAGQNQTQTQSAPVSSADEEDLPF